MIASLWIAPVQATLFGLSPRPLYAWRSALLRLFGARVGRKVLVRPTARFAYPWKVEIGDFSWIGDNVEVYSLDRITIGRNSVVSQRSYLCSASHDPSDPAFGYITGPIVIGDQVWIASEVFVNPGVTISDGAVVGVRSVVFHDVGPGLIAFGAPARVRAERRTR